MNIETTREIDSREFLRDLSRKAKHERIPLAGALALTHRCNLVCAHCYLPVRERGGSDATRELSAERVCSLIDEIAGAGCLFLLITGGEPLLRTDFPRIYRYAKSRGLLVTIFTNGTLIDREIAALFGEFPPRSIEISLYGATTATCGKVTGVEGSYENCMRGVRLLLDRGIPVKLKSIIMTHNRRELGAMEETAQQLGVPFRTDSALFPRLDGDRSPLALRIPPAEAVAGEVANGERMKKWAAYYERRKGIPSTDRLYTCGAGLTHFYIDPYGTLQPCSMAIHFRYRLSQGDFLAAWRDLMPRFRERKAGPGYACNSCDKRVLCGLCPAFFRMESGSETRRSEYLCRTGHLRFEAVRGAATVPD